MVEGHVRASQISPLEVVSSLPAVAKHAGSQRGTPPRPSEVMHPHTAQD